MASVSRGVAAAVVAVLSSLPPQPASRAAAAATRQGFRKGCFNVVSWGGADKAPPSPRPRKARRSDRTDACAARRGSFRLDAGGLDDLAPFLGLGLLELRELLGRGGPRLGARGLVELLRGRALRR